MHVLPIDFLQLVFLIRLGRKILKFEPFSLSNLENIARTPFFGGPTLIKFTRKNRDKTVRREQESVYVRAYVLCE